MKTRLVFIVIGIAALLYACSQDSNTVMSEMASEVTLSDDFQAYGPRGHRDSTHNDSTGCHNDSTRHDSLHRGPRVPHVHLYAVCDSQRVRCDSTWVLCDSVWIPCDTLQFRQDSTHRRHRGGHHRTGRRGGRRR